VVEEAGAPGENQQQATGKLYHLQLRVECTLFCNLQRIFPFVRYFKSVFSTILRMAVTI
jgi:hypothetical protein